MHVLRSAPRTLPGSAAAAVAVRSLAAVLSAAAVIAAPLSPPLRRNVHTPVHAPRRKRRLKGSLLPRPGSVAFVEPRVLLPVDDEDGMRSPRRYAGPIPACPRTLDDPAPEMTAEMLAVPTSELYSVALEAAWRELDDHDDLHSDQDQDRAKRQREQRRPTPDRVAQLEPDSKEYSAPRPRHYGPYAIERASLDWSYHVVPSRARQQLQDEIVSLVLEQRLRDCKDAGDDEPCRVFEARERFREQEQSAENGTVAHVDEQDMGRKGADGRPGDKGRPLALFTAG